MMNLVIKICCFIFLIICVNIIFKNLQNTEILMGWSNAFLWCLMTLFYAYKE